MIVSMKKILCFLFVLSSIYAFAKATPASRNNIHPKEYHVSVEGDDANDGSQAKPFKTIMAAAGMAMPGDMITVHAGVYREQITPPRGGNSDKERIIYRAAKGEKVIIKGSEIIKGWQKLEKDTWVVKIPNNLFGSFNPYKKIIQGDWFTPTPNDRKYLRGAVYLNGDWLMEAAKKEEVFRAADEKNMLWCASVDGDSTTIWSQFKTDPNYELVEINVRETVFYPDKPFINYITVSGFTMEQAATNWAPPTAEQKGLIGTHWSRGWVIENNTVQYSKCVGIALGKYGDEFDNRNTESAEGYVGTINRALAFGWNKATVGSHIVRNNTIAYCEQTGIVGSMGCAFSVVEGNVIHDIHVRNLFNGAEMAGIKFHGAVDVQITGNRIYNTTLGIWLDWMAQGVQVKNNLLYDNHQMDLFLEVDHGPMLVSNNVMLSKTNLYMNSSGAAFVHNLFKGKVDIINYDSRLTPYMLPHSTFVKALHDNPSGDVRFINNLFVNGADVSQYSKALLPISFDGNVYTKGTVRIKNIETKKSYGEMTEAGKEKMKAYKEQIALERNAIVDTTFDAAEQLITQNDKVYLQISLDRKWLQRKRQLLTTGNLGKTIVPGLLFENVDGSPVKISADYFGKQRDTANPSPGPFEIKSSGSQKIKLW